MTPIPERVQTWLEKNGYGAVVSSQAASGGCINNGVVLATTTGDTVFLKTNRHAPPSMFAREWEGLAALRVEGGPTVPRALLQGDAFLLLEDLSPAPRCAGYWATFGRQLATLHTYTNHQFGFSHDNYIGSTPQPNPWTEDGYLFFAEQRLEFQAHLARERGLLSLADAKKVKNIAHRLEDLIPDQPASLIHGDLWSGNAITDAQGAPAIIDPAAHYGWPEAELAMTSLFGTFPREFYYAYQEIRFLEPEYRDRFPLYNLYHLLNHLNLFGTGYLRQVRSVIGQFE
ncbi:MAG: fructosamine kinase family protein [Chloroflexota bacterium]|nr:fructosamine kinase family protein [Chloroflexota bacterium]